MGRIIAVNAEAFEGTEEYKAIPAGTKLQANVFSIEEVTVKSGPNQGKPQFVWTAKVAEGEHKGKEIRYNYVPLYAEAKNLWNLTAFAKAVGWKMDADTGQVEIPDNLSDVLGTQVTIKVSINERGYNQVASVAKAQAGGGDENTPPKEKPASWSDLSN